MVQLPCRRWFPRSQTSPALGSPVRQQRAGVRPGVERLEERRLPATFIVTSTGDNGGINPAPHAGTGTLRQAIVDANANPGLDTIQFKINSGAQSIALQNALPPVTDAVVLDGTTQPGFGGHPLIELNGSGAGNEADGLVIAGGNSTIRGLILNRFAENGIALTSSGNVVAGNLIGTDPAGTTRLANGGDGVAVFSPGNTVGGTDPADGNLISGNGHNGVDLIAGNNVVTGNRIGTDANGAAALGNGADGVAVYSTGNTIGGGTAAPGNLISGNAGNGVDLVGGGNLVAGNLIGVSAAGAALGNGGDGVLVFSAKNTIGGTAAGQGNLVSGNARNGVEITGAGATGNVVEGNRIGTDSAGTAPVGNGGAGVIVFASQNAVGGTAAGAGNLVSGNGDNGIDLDGTGNVVQGNRVGTDLTGTAALGNAGDGVAVFASGNTVGGTSPGAGNIISGNAGYGVDLVAGGNLVQGNSVGTNAGGTAALGNARDGIIIFAANNTIGGNGAGAGNVICGNGGSGIDITGAPATGNLVQGNAVGTDVRGTADLGNARDGVLIQATGNTVGDTAAAGQNVIAFNRGNGINLGTSVGNALLQNVIFGNGLQAVAGGNSSGTPAAQDPLMVTLPHHGRDTLVRVADALTGKMMFQFTAFPGWHGGLAVALADMNGDGFADVIAVSFGGKGGGRVRVLDGRTQQPLAGPLGSFTAVAGLQGIPSVSVSDYDHDGVPDLVLGVRVGTRRQTRVYSGRTGGLLALLKAAVSNRPRRRS